VKRTVRRKINAQAPKSYQLRTAAVNGCGPRLWCASAIRPIQSPLPVGQKEAAFQFVLYICGKKINIINNVGSIIQPKGGMKWHRRNPKK
jgi:hypothetical protein